jgi:hypothetical protein
MAHVHGKENELKDKTVANLSLARRIRAAGRPIYIAEDDGEARCIPSDALRVYQYGGVTESSVSALSSSGGIAVILYLGISINLPHFAIAAFGLELPWENNSFWWLADPFESYSNSQCYSFGRRDFPDFERGQVLNHYAGGRQIYTRSLKGALLGFGLDSVPKEFSHGMMIPAFVVIYDQFWRECRSPVKLWLDRSRTRSRVLPKRAGLFACRDKG